MRDAPPKPDWLGGKRTICDFSFELGATRFPARVIVCLKVGVKCPPVLWHQGFARAGHTVVPPAHCARRWSVTEPAHLPSAASVNRVLQRRRAHRAQFVAITRTVAVLASPPFDDRGAWASALAQNLEEVVSSFG